MSARAMCRARARQQARDQRQEAGRRRRSAGVIGAAAAIGGAGVIFAPAAEAATFTVTNLQSSGAGSLRRALNDADAAAGPDQVVFQSGLSGKITLGAEISVVDGVDIVGPGRAQIEVNGDGAGRIFSFYALPAGNRQASLSGLKLAGGSADYGGAVYSSGADLTISNATITTSSATVSGGAVYSAGSSLTVLDSNLTYNTADGAGAGVYAFNSPLVVRGSSLAGNEAQGSGGAIYAYGDPAAAPAAVTISDSSLSANYARSDGGGAYLAASAPVTITRTTVSGNDANRSGGGLLVGYGANAGAVTITESTVSGNRALRRDGGGISITGPSGPTTLQNATISGNEAGRSGGGIGIYNYNDTAITIANSTVAGNKAGSLLYGGGGVYQYGGDTVAVGTPGDTTTLSSTIVGDNEAPVEPDLGGGGGGYSYFASGFSLVEVKPTVAYFTGTPSGSNVTGEDPALGGLYDNGGATYTHNLYGTSPALDAGVANGLATDQRGAPRTLDLPGESGPAGSDATDIGAVEAIACQEKSASLTEGTSADDNLKGDGSRNLIYGAAGADQLVGKGGGDCLVGGEGNDKANGGGGGDELRGGAGKDTLRAKGGKDDLRGQAGKDRLLAAGGGKDRVDCGPGKDSATVDSKDEVAKDCERVNGG